MSVIIRSGSFREWTFWALALILLPILASTRELPSFCLYQWMGFVHCPGCGIGASIGLFIKGQWAASLQAHWLGIPACIAILLRWMQLTRNLFFTIPETIHHA